ncbi:hypothetical protein ABZ299_22865 [Streptomyces sp. NPDC006184]
MHGHTVIADPHANAEVVLRHARRCAGESVAVFSSWARGSSGP